MRERSGMLLDSSLVALTTASALNVPWSLTLLVTLGDVMATIDDGGANRELWKMWLVFIALSSALAIGGFVLIRRRRSLERLRPWQTGIAIVVGLPLAVALAIGAINLGFAV